MRHCSIPTLRNCQRNSTNCQTVSEAEARQPWPNEYIKHLRQRRLEWKTNLIASCTHCSLFVLFFREVYNVARSINKRPARGGGRGSSRTPFKFSDNSEKSVLCSQFLLPISCFLYLFCSVLFNFCLLWHCQLTLITLFCVLICLRAKVSCNKLQSCQGSKLKLAEKAARKGLHAAEETGFKGSQKNVK